MDQIGKTFISIMALCIIAFIGAGIVSASLDATSAQRDANTIVNELEDSNYSSSVENSILDDIKSKSSNITDIKIEKLDANHDSKTDSCVVTVSYKYSIGILNVTDTSHFAKAYAR